MKRLSREAFRTLVHLLVSSLRDSIRYPSIPGTDVPGFPMPPLRGWNGIDDLEHIGVATQTP